MKPCFRRVATQSLLVGALLAAVLIASWAGFASGTLTAEVSQPDATRVAIRDRLEADPHGHFVHLLGNNLRAIIMLLLMGACTAGLYVVLGVAVFGFDVARRIAALSACGLSGGAIGAMLLPHAVLEVPALCLAGGVGLRCGLMFTRYLRGGVPIEPGERRILLWGAGLAVALVPPAAALEAYVTPMVALGHLP